MFCLKIMLFENHFFWKSFCLEVIHHPRFLFEKNKMKKIYVKVEFANLGSHFIRMSSHLFRIFNDELLIKLFRLDYLVILNFFLEMMNYGV